jgi:hypothetical protein
VYDFTHKSFNAYRIEHLESLAIAQAKVQKAVPTLEPMLITITNMFQRLADPQSVCYSQRDSVAMFRKVVALKVGQLFDRVAQQPSCGFHREMVNKTVPQIIH